MELYGWDYTGRNIGPKLHRQFYAMVSLLSDPSFIMHETWDKPFQERLARRIQASSSGVLRTIKTICENFGFLQQAALRSHVEIDPTRLLTRRGELVYHLAGLEQQVAGSDQYSSAVKDQISAQIKLLYEEVYCDALQNYYFRYADGTTLHPLRATLRALRKYGQLDKWEWYLLNTFVRRDGDTQGEAALDHHISRYRNGKLVFTMDDVAEKPKGHQYIPQYFEYAGLLRVRQRPT